ncbi:MAG: DUF2140 domain-containing protein [Clostridiaceae bacterium]|nr:DUF2140 domain-containing protein [Clostridiaceae bacterium]
MNKGKNNKRFKIWLSVLSIIIISIGVFFYMLLWNSSYTVPQAKISASILDDIKKSYNQDLVLELNTEDLNGIINMYFKSSKSFGKVTIKGVHSDILDNNLKLYIPIRYNGYNLLLSSEGQLLYKDNKVIYKPDYFKAGKISLPKSMVLDKLKSKLKKGIAIENDNIAIDKSFFILDIKNVEIKNNKVLVSVQKPSVTLEEKLKSLQQGLKVPGAAESSSTNSKGDNSSDQELNKGKSNSTEEVISSNKNSSERNEALDRINSGLGAAMSSVSTGGQKAVISQMISVVNTMKSNPSYNPYAAESSVRSIYKNLTPKEKSELKSAVFSNVDGDSVNIVAKIMGM